MISAPRSDACLLDSLTRPRPISTDFYNSSAEFLLYEPNSLYYE